MINHTESRRPHYYLPLRATNHFTNWRMLSGAICAVFRPGLIGGYEVGSTVMVGCPYSVFCFEATIAHSQIILIKSLDEDKLRRLGVSSKEELIKDLKKIYKDVDEQTCGAYVAWTDARGFLVDEADEYRISSKKPYGEIDHDLDDC